MDWRGTLGDIVRDDTVIPFLISLIASVLVVAAGVVAVAKVISLIIG